MKKPSFFALLYREWALSEKSFRVSAGACAAGFLMFGLIILSLKVGNLSKLSPDLTSLLMGEGRIIMKILPTVIMSSFLMIQPDVALIDANPKWEWFRRSTPVSCFRYALVKGVFCALMILVAIAFSLVGTAVACAAIGVDIDKSDIAMDLVLILVLL